VTPASATVSASLPGISPEISISPIEPHHRSSIQDLLRATGVFRESEVQVALEVIDSYFILPEGDYTALGAFTRGSELLGYVCYGPTPCTMGTWDLYWIAVSPEAQGSGVGSQLLKEVERRLALKDARLVIIETSSQPQYSKTRAFYAGRGYEVVARVPDFYAEGDDRLILAKRIQFTQSGQV
jgi:ribosomal protein S18 acetylase RimI-like enzyme